MKKIILSIMCLFSSASIFAQDFEYGKITQEEANLKSVPFADNADAVVLREFGSSSIDFSEAALFVDFTYHVKIKVLNADGLRFANVTVPLAVNKKSRYENMVGANRPIAVDEDDVLLGVKATTVNVVNGKVVRTELDQKTITREKKNSQTILVKLDLPNVKEGSIIEYSYSLKLPGIHQFKKWEFQGEIPKLYSEYVANIPVIYEYDIALKGDLKLDDNKAVAAEKCFRFGTLNIDCSKMIYVMKDIPAFSSQNYVADSNSIPSSVNFNLRKYRTMVGGEAYVKRSWEDVDVDLLADKFFGGQLKRQAIFKSLLPAMTAGANDDLSKAKAIYAYIAGKIKSNGVTDIYSDPDIKTALDKGTGSTGDINLALVTALSAAKLDAQPFLLSTREHGTLNEAFPDIKSFDYVVAIVNIGDSSYLLDASVPGLPFGSLTKSAMNGNGRAIKGKKDSYWVDLAPSAK